jgi:2OG-Fe(II) oxygenase superfamily
MADVLWSKGFVLINDFADRRTCADLLDAVNDYRDRHRLPCVERHTRGRDLRYQVIDGSRIACALPTIGPLLAKTDATVTELSCRPLVRLEGQAGVNVNITPPGGSYRWHYDRCPVTAILYLNTVSGGEIEFYPNARLPCGPFEGTVLQRYVDAVTASRGVRTLARRRRVAVPPAAGRLLIIRGDHCLHSVSGVRDGPDRINLVVSYTTPGGERALPNLDTYLYSEEAFALPDPNYRYLQ